MEFDIKLPSEIGPYKLIRKLGSGRKSLFALYDLQIMGKIQFIKIYKISNFESQTEYVEFLENLRRFMNLEHPNINFYDDIFDDSENLYLASKYCEKGNIGDFILHNGPFTESVSRSIFRQLISAVQFLHDRQIAHCDIKPEHILLDSDLKVILTDFEYAMKEGDKRRRIHGTFLYAAPEVVQQNYDLFAADMWSLGIILYILISGKLPWDPKDPHKTVEEQIRTASFELPSNASPSCNDLIKHLIDPDPHSRFSFEEIVTHPWLSQNKRLAAFLSESSPMLLRSNKSFSLPTDDNIKPRNSQVLRQSSDQKRKYHKPTPKRSFPTFM